MKVYWQAREKEDDPLDSKDLHFFCRPFFSSLSPFSSSSERVRTLCEEETYQVMEESFLPDKKEWIANVEKVLEQKLPKVVLARCHRLRLDRKVNPFALAAFLQKKSEGAFLFVFADQNKAFLGLSPERLFSRKGLEIQTEALAGTLPKTKDASLFGEKEKKEWRFVQEFLEEKLSPLATEKLLFSSPKIHKTHNLQHLISKACFQLKENLSDSELIDLLHPTPALLGTPSEKALEWIKKLEPFDRFLYGGIVGWHNSTSSDQVVAIRSCYLEEEFAYLYTGAGIVEGSDPEKEWEELNHKEALYQDAFLKMDL